MTTWEAQKQVEKYLKEERGYKNVKFCKGDDTRSGRQVQTVMPKRCIFIVTKHGILQVR